MSPKTPRDSQTTVMLFIAGAALIVGAATLALVKNWATFDPLVTASMIGVGLLLIVIYERLGHMHTELRTIAFHLDRLDNASVRSGVVDAKSTVADAK
jgi:hypothetical protein